MPRTKKEEEQVVTPESDTEDPVAQTKKSKRRKKDKKDKKSKRKTNKAQEPQEESEVDEESAPKKSKTNKSKKAKAPEPDTEDVESTGSAAPAESANDEGVDSQFDENRGKTDELFKSFIATVQERIASDKALLSSLRELNRQVARERKEVGKVIKKLVKGQRKKRRGGNKSPGGFTKPAALSPQMCAFLEVPEGTELPRTEVTRRVNTYVKANDLQNPENKKQILADGKLRTLLYLKEDDELTYFNLQRYMKIHFLKKDSETGDVSAFIAPVVS